MNSAARALSTAIQIQVEVIEGPNKGLRQSFTDVKWSIGRGPENHLVISSDIKVSRNHVEIRSMSAQVFARNLNPKNPMLIDGNLTVEAILKPGSLIQVGDSVLRLHFEQVPVGARLAPVPANMSSERTNIHSPVTGVTNSSPGFPRQGGLPGAAFPGTGPRPIAPNYEIPLLSHPRFRMFLILGAVGLAVLWLLNEAPPSRKSLGLRDSVAITAEVGTSESEVKRILDERREFDSPQYRLAQAQYIKGFRDYQQGQYARAMEAFQSARAFYPKHELATKYWTLAKRKFDEQVQSYMVQGRRYRGTQNYRLCQSSFAAVLMLIKDDRNAIYQEARQYHDECRLKAAGN